MAQVGGIGQSVGDWDSDSRVYVGPLASGINGSFLVDLFSKYGAVTAVDLKRGFAFVQFDNREMAQAACDGLDSTKLSGTDIVLTVSLTKRGDRRKLSKCYRCGRSGHLSRNCDRSSRSRSRGSSRRDRSRSRGRRSRSRSHGRRRRSRSRSSDRHRRRSSRSRSRDHDRSSRRHRSRSRETKRSRWRSPSRSRSPSRRRESRRSRSPRRDERRGGSQRDENSRDSRSERSSGRADERKDDDAPELQG